MVQHLDATLLGVTRNWLALSADADDAEPHLSDAGARAESSAPTILANASSSLA